ncbi:MAG: hypothetical protein JWO44_1868, partial [Bacteroidetes bacterium]|nr:hypothetical protein [Bacteroidota bacterium]
HVRSTYYRSDLSGALSLHKLESPVFSFESYQLAYTPVLLAEIYGTKAGDALMAEGKYTHSEGDASWWIRSGTIQYLEGTESAADAQNRFYLPISYTDPYGSKTKVSYYGSYFLFIEATEDALGNRSRTERFNFRTLSAERMKDINDNLSEAIADELGLVKAMAVFGKGAEADDLAGINDFTDAVENSLVSSFFNVPDTADHVADSVKLAALGKQLLKHSTSRFVYDFDVYKNTGKPVVVASITREEHFKKSSDSPVQLSFEYSNGLGQVVMKKMQAEPGTAKKVSVNADDTYTVAGEDTSGLVPAQLRWIGNGKTILNNKGNAVKQYEPYFSVNHRYEDLKELVETGVTPILYYDAPGRVIRTELPDGTFSKVEFDSWKQCAYDASDTVLESSWYSNRTGRLIDALLLAEGKDPAREKEAADKAAKHGNTPSQLHLDTLGRTVLTIEHNRNITTAADEYFRTKVNLDAEGNLRSVSDARGNTVMEYKYDMLGNLVYQKSMDAGCRWLLVNILGNPLRTWDERDHEFRYFYDELHRPLYSVVTGGDGTAALNNIFERIVYAESLLLPGRTNEAALKAINILGKPLKHYDTGGMIETAEYDFKGQAIATTRRLFKKYQSVADWTDANILTDLETESFTFASETDALGRITKQTAPDGSIITPSYNEAGLLNGEAVEHKDPSLTSTYIKNIDYNEKGQRSRIIYGNDVTTDFYYDKETFRLKRLETKRKNNDPLQDWHYTFDPVGNITHIEDKNVPLVFFNNSKVTGISEYTYDALYRLVEATGRENNAALTFSSSDNWNDVSYMQRMNEGDPMSVRNYTQKYQYDAAGNMEQMKHLATGNNWTRAFTYEAASNRLSTTQIGTETYRYSHHVKHGFISKMPQLEEMEWSFKEELVKTIRQKRTDGGTPETTYYQYDGKGQRIRKITENAADKGITATRKEERIYISGYETFRRYTLDALDFERESLSLLDGGHRFVMVETVKKNTDTAPDPSDMIGARLVRYQLHNHLGSAALELDGTDDAAVISYEEYHPFGTTAYQANNAAIKASAKRYRYTGMERDEETGLEYHSARYYLPWLGRWLSTDPIGIGDGVNLYRYVGNNPVMMHDPTGTDGEVCKPDDVFEFSSPENMVCQEPIAEESAADPKDSPDVFVSPEEDSTSVGEVALSILFLPLTLTGCSSPTPKPPSTISGNYVIIAGGTSVNDPGGHDKKGSNFLDSAARRAKDIIANNPGAKVTVIMYSPDDLSYQKRAVTDKKDKFFYEDLMRDSATKNKYELVIIKKGTELTPLLNTAKDGQIKQLEYFGHSNASDFLLEYSSSVPARSTDRWGMGGSEVTGVRKEIFQPTGEVIFYGCNLGDTGGLGEDVKKRWGLETTASDIKTDYSSTVGSNWKPDGHYIKMK